MKASQFRPCFKRASIALSLLPMVAPTLAVAQGESASLEEVVVTAQRREESIQSVPIAISALSANALENAGVTSSTQLAAVVPNLQVNSSFGNTQPNFSLRGVSVANEYNANQASPIGIYIDEAYMASRTLHGMQLYDLDRVEVLRGPQGTLYGRNTTGGAINFITKGPELGDANGFIEAGYGNFNDRRLQGAGEVTLVPDVFGVRAAFNYEKSDGFLDNKYSGGKDPNSNDSVSGRVEFRLRPTDELDVKLKLYAGRDKPTQAAVHARGTGPGATNPLTGYSREADGLDFFEVNQDKIGRSETKARGALFRVDYTINDRLSFSSLTSADGGEQNLGQDADGSPFNVLYINWESDFSQFNQEFHLDYSGDNLTWIAGLYYGTDSTKTTNTFDFFHFLQGLGVPADPVGLAAGGFSIVQKYKQVRDSAAVFAQADYTFDDHWSATLGIRYTQDKAEYKNGRSYTTDYDGNPAISLIPTPGPYSTATLPTQDEDSEAVTGRAALTYTLDSGQIIYASYSRGYRSGTFNGSGYLSASQIVYVDPETVNAYEVGTKGFFFDHRLSLATSAFYYDYANQQVQEVVGAVALLRNAGTSTIKGADVEFRAALDPDFTLNGSLGLLDATYDKLTLSGNDLSGNSLPFAPDLTAQLGFDWRIAEIGGGDLSLAPSVNYYAEQWFSPFNDDNGNEHLQQDSYTKVDANLSWRRDELTLRLWGTNLTNKEYYGYGLDLRDTFGYDFLIPGSPRAFGIAARFEY